MQADSLVDRILDDEGLTRDLDEAEATLLVDALVKRAQVVAAATDDVKAARFAVESLCKRARAIAATVSTFRVKGHVEGRLVAHREELMWPERANEPLEVLRGLLGELRVRSN